jgi:hypothetical protein
LGLGLGEPGPGGRGAGEDDPRQPGEVGFGVLAEQGVAGRQRALVGGDVDELGGAGDISGRPHPRVRGPQPLIGHDRAAAVGGHPGRLQAQAGGVGPAPGGDQHFVGVDHDLGATGGGPDAAHVPVAFHDEDLGGGVDGGALADQHPGQGLGYLGFLERGDPLCDVQEGD